MSTFGKTNEPAPPYESPVQTPGLTNHTIETINRTAASPARQMEIVQNVAPPPQIHTTPLNLLREQSEYVFCPQKGQIVKSRAESKDSDKTWFAVIGLCLICPCVACFPLKGCCGDGMLQDWDHYCEGCGKQLTHRPYNHETQILRPDHDAGNAMGWQNAQPQGHYAPQMAYAPQQQPQYATQ